MPVTGASSATKLKPYFLEISKKLVKTDAHSHSYLDFCDFNCLVLRLACIQITFALAS
jgi:hypothetical protein